MRTITEKDRRGLLVAFRLFVKQAGGERVGAPEGDAMLGRALSAGLSFDEILNKENWRRACDAAGGTLGAEQYITALTEGTTDVRPLTAEPMWHDPVLGFDVIVEAAHDFYKEVTGRGGKWNIPSAKTNLAHAISRHGLQALLSEAFIAEVNATGENRDDTFFGYILAVVKDFGTFNPEKETEEQALRRAAAEREREELERSVGDDGEPVPEGDGDPEPEPEPEDGEGEPDHDPEDEPFPERAPSYGDGISSGFQINPRTIKLDCIRNFIMGYTPDEIRSLADTVDSSQSLTLDELIARLTDGDFDPSKESTTAAEVHRTLNSDLMPSFISCVQSLDLEIDDEEAARYDPLKCSWDLRTPAVRKLYKVRRAISDQIARQRDTDLVEALADIERLYAQD